MIKISLDKQSITKLERNLKEISKSLSELFEFVLKPRRYFEIVLRQSNERIVKRLAIYFFILESLAFCLIVAAEHKATYAVDKIVGSVVFDVLSGIPFILILILAFRLAGVSSPIKKALVFFLTSKIVFGFLPIFFDVFFRVTEDYVFAVLRALAILGAILYIILAGGFIFADDIRRRMTIIASSLVMFMIFIAGYGILSTNLNVSFAGAAKFSPLYDPIAEEFMLAKTTFYDATKIVDYGSFINKLEPHSKFEMDYAAYFKLRLEWNDKSAEFSRIVDEYLDKIAKNEFKYETNKEIFGEDLKGYLVELTTLDTRLSDLFCLLPINEEFKNKYIEALKCGINSSNASVDFLEKFTAYLKLITKLGSLNIIVTAH
jgi:hypothetical protein